MFAITAGSCVHSLLTCLVNGETAACVQKEAPPFVFVKGQACFGLNFSSTEVGLFSLCLWEAGKEQRYPGNSEWCKRF